jgi:TrmH family RNA methyltransferase
MKQIYSRENELYKLAKRLHARNGREKFGAFLIEGPKLIAEAVDSGVCLRYLIYSDEFPQARHSVRSEVESQNPQARHSVRSEAESQNPLVIGMLGEVGSASKTENILSSSEKMVFSSSQPSLRVAVVDRVLFSEMAETLHPQGVLAVADLPEPVDVFSGVSSGSAYVVLDRIQDPGNVGTLIRTAFAAGFDAAVIVKGCADCYSGKVLRAAAGAVFRLPLLFAESAEDAATALRSNGVKIFAADAGGKNSLYDTDIRGSVALVIGNEGGGLSEAFSDADLLRIPMREGAESLNAAIAAAVLMFEKQRQEEE